MLSIHNLNICRSNRCLLNIDNLAIHPKNIIGLMGANGAGKTTLLQHMSGLEKTQKKVLLHQTPIENWPPKILAKHLAVLSQHTRMAFNLTAQQVVELGATPLRGTKKSIHFSVKKLMQKTDTWELKEQNISSLSGGEQQRIHLARVLLQLSQCEKAPLLFMDEPTSAQDIKQQHQVLKFAIEYCHALDGSCVITLHDLPLAQQYCSDIWLLRTGNCISKGSTSEVLTKHNIQQAWAYSPRLASFGNSASSFWL